MKKRLCILLFCMCVCSISACGDKGGSDNSKDIPASSLREENTEDKEEEESKDHTDAVGNTDEEESTEHTDAKGSADAEENTAVEGNVDAEENADTGLIDGMRPEFKEAMDSYEAFYVEYCDFMEQYKENPTDMELLTGYTDMMAKAAEMSEKFDAWEESEMNDAELNYYLDVNNRITKKLLEVSE